MAKASAVPQWQRALVALTGTVVAVVVVGTLYWAQAIFIPLALAIFLAFLLNPLVRALQRRGLGRIPSVITIVLFAGLLLGGLGWLVGRQVTQLMADLPNHTDKVRAKIKTLKALGNGNGRLIKMLEEIGGELKPAPKGPEEGGPAETPTAVAIAPARFELPAWLSKLHIYLGSAAEALVGFALTLVLLVFMLLNREDLRNRFLRLVGHVSSTTKAVDEAGQRVSRYLLMQAIVNGTYGVAVALGLFFIGVEHALLWGFLAAVVRYIPYVGPWVGAVLPITLSVVTSDGWWQPLTVISLFVALELLSNNVMEPYLYGQSMGVSVVAQLVSAAFWAFLWGPVGLVLSAPLTVVLLVLGKYVPQLKFLDVLLGDEPALTPDLSYYQRLLARDQDEATEQVLARLKGEAPELVYDELLVPVLNYVKRDRDRDLLTDSDRDFILNATQEVLDDLGALRDAGTPADAAFPPDEDAANGQPAAVPQVVLTCLAEDPADQLAMIMLQQSLDPARWKVESVAVTPPMSGVIQEIARQKPDVLCIGALPPGGLAHARYFCKRLRMRFPRIKIVVGRWGLTGDMDIHREQFREAGADHLATSIINTRDFLERAFPRDAAADPDIKQVQAPAPQLSAV